MSSASKDTDNNIGDSDDRSFVRHGGVILDYRVDRPSSLSLPRDPRSVFHEVIATNADVCRQCLSRVRTSEDIDPTRGKKFYGFVSSVDRESPPPGIEGVDYDATELEYWRDSTIERRYISEYVRGKYPSSKRRYCDGCGNFDIYSKNDTHSVDSAVDASVNLSVSLSEYGIVHDPIALTMFVQKAKRVPRLSGDDNTVFGVGVEVSILSVDPLFDFGDEGDIIDDIESHIKSL